jgi:site-specific DNA-methyltransferase (adenine-specific)
VGVVDTIAQKRWHGYQITVKITDAENAMTMEDRTKVFNCDCLPAMKEFPDKHFDLAIVDPPFGIGVNKNKFMTHRNHGTYKNDATPPLKYFKLLQRISKLTIICGCQYYIHRLNPEGSFIIWDKKADPDLHNMSSCDVAWYSKRERIRTFNGHWCGAIKIDNEKTIHVHQKPVALYKWLLKNYAKEGDKILDTHLGSQSSRIAAYDLGFDFTGYEMDKDYFEAGNKRFAQHKAQLKLFTPSKSIEQGK